MNQGPAGYKALWEITTDTQGTAKIHPLQRTLIITECFLCAKNFARYFT